eukprot:CAMPEP_0172879050 /NCGR_PEP_ID=MMETSP1075-20121228/111361_1 /TAXON_ID=2916 /ORGANISM="Ceratium fusus, Strain PA161109" /LENGTH=452 /DNA_ID=CAMNT_0013730975 /DNA_START=9 /DNA_END=1364 /DNA_ORIENTATION=+
MVALLPSVRSAIARRTLVTHSCAVLSGLCRWRQLETVLLFGQVRLVGNEHQQRRHAVSSKSQAQASEAPAADTDGRTAALQVTVLGAATNVSLAAVKYVTGSMTGSTALVADAAHSMSDLLSDLVTLFVVDAARHPPDEKHPYGHGRFETLGSLSVGAILVATAGGVGWHASLDIYGWWQTDTLGDTLTSSGFGGYAVAACIFSLASKEALYHATVRVGHEVNSQILIANAWHHRSDALSSVAALVGVGGSLAGMPLLDPLAGLFVSGLVAKVGIEIGYESVCEVTERVMVDSHIRESVNHSAAETPGVVRIDRLRTRKMGPYFLVDVVAEVDPQISISAAHHVAERLRREIHKSQKDVSEVLVNVVPFKQGGSSMAGATLMRTHSEVENEVRLALQQIPAIRGVSDVVTHYEPDVGIHLQVDICCAEDITVQMACQIGHEAKDLLSQLPDV